MAEDFEVLYQGYTRRQKELQKDDVKTQYNSQFEDVTQLSNQYGSLGEVFRTSEKQSHDNNGRKRRPEGKFGDFSLLLRRTYNWDLSSGDKWTMKLEIRSTVLRQAFKEIAKGFTSTSLEQDPIMIEEPFSDIYFCRYRIQKAIEEASSDELKKELELLETFRKSYMGKTITAIETSLTEGTIKADDLWSLFPIGSKIILQNRNTQGRTLIWCVVVKSCFAEESSEKEPKVWTINAEFTSFNGKQFEYVEGSFSIGGFRGAKEIRSLPAYPLDMHPQKEKLRQALIDRGKRYVELCIGESRKTTHAGQGSHCSYSGPFWQIPARTGVDFFSMPTRQVRL
jgi:hypothetical protein